MLVEISLLDGKTVDPSGRRILARTVEEVERGRAGRVVEALTSRCTLVLMMSGGGLTMSTSWTDRGFGDALLNHDERFGRNFWVGTRRKWHIQAFRWQWNSGAGSCCCFAAGKEGGSHRVNHATVRDGNLTDHSRYQTSQQPQRGIPARSSRLTCSGPGSTVHSSHLGRLTPLLYGEYACLTYASSGAV